MPKKRKSKNPTVFTPDIYGPGSSIQIQADPPRVLTPEEEEAREARLREFFPRPGLSCGGADT